MLDDASSEVDKARAALTSGETPLPLFSRAPPAPIFARRPLDFFHRFLISFTLIYWEKCTHASRSMYNLLKNLMIMRSLSAVAAVFMVTLFSPLALFAAEKPVTFRGQTIYVDGTKYQNFNDWKGVTLLIQGILEGRRVLTL